MRVKLVVERDSKKRSVKEAIAFYEEILFEAEQKGNTVKAKVIKSVLKRLRSKLVKRV